MDPTDPEPGDALYPAAPQKRKAYWPPLSFVDVVLQTLLGKLRATEACIAGLFGLNLISKCVVTGKDVLRDARLFEMGRGQIYGS